jgi:hypothetical protein
VGGEGGEAGDEQVAQALVEGGGGVFLEAGGEQVRPQIKVRRLELLRCG